MSTKNMMLDQKFDADQPWAYATRPGRQAGQDPGGKLAEIRLVKIDENTIRFSPEIISFWYSRTNGNFQKYQGPLHSIITKKWQLGYPYSDAQNTLMCFQRFDLLQDVRHFEIRCAKTSPACSLVNDIENLIELVNEHGQIILCDASTENQDPKSVYTQT